MRKHEKYWTYQAGDIPEISDLPPGTFKGDEKAWNSLSPGMRREIYRQAIRMVTKKNPRESEPAFELEAMIDRYSLAKVCDMLAGICGEKADHIQTNWQDGPLARRWQTASNRLHTLSGVFGRKSL